MFVPGEDVPVNGNKYKGSVARAAWGFQETTTKASVD
jgi:hypothetical protein